MVSIAQSAALSPPCTSFKIFGKRVVDDSTQWTRLKLRAIPMFEFFVPSSSIALLLTQAGSTHRTVMRSERSKNCPFLVALSESVTVPEELSRLFDDTMSSLRVPRETPSRSVTNAAKMIRFGLETLMDRIPVVGLAQDRFLRAAEWVAVQFQLMGVEEIRAQLQYRLRHGSPPHLAETPQTAVLYCSSDHKIDPETGFFEPPTKEERMCAAWEEDMIKLVEALLRDGD